MVEDIAYIKPKPKAVYLWTVTDVQKWLRRHCGDYYQLYCEHFLKHDIAGRALIKINNNTLIRIGVKDPVHRERIWREIVKLKLKTDIMEIKELEIRNNYSAYDLHTVPV